MKRIFLLMAMLCLGILAACGNDGKQKETTESSGDEQQATEEQKNHTGKNAENQELNNEKSVTELDANNRADKLKGFKEYSNLKKEIPNLDKYEPIIETDNPNKRVILYKVNQQKEYKSIFIKRQNRLKIIKLGDGGEIFNKVIE
ncbi:hypothetical protein QR721_01845 [Aciduricibacillus chroicocephali]|uniref:Lipoprotein n=1 Tax=Aciduricibacillus chroicocephali TaxID=3054939 RepID=A0ABY9KW91_9BACI|nr:hypothetical protein QR721_01845 [Bacillaceae bacterium 44XB]